MYEFVDRLFNVALPRVRDFRGINPNSFDGRGNYNMGIKEQLIFPEIDYDKIDKVRGMDICFVTTANTDEESRELLISHGRPVCEIRRDYCGQNFYENQAAERPAKFSSRAVQQMQNLWQAACLSSQVRYLPHLLPGACLQGRDSGREKGQLVKLSKGGNGMQITDTIADLLTRIRNANSAKHDSVDIPASNMKKAICQILVDEGYVKNFTVVEDGKQGIIKVNLKYGEGKTPVIKGLRRVSKPGLRIYSSAEELPKVMKGLGVAIISTSKGVMTDRQARKENVGGEVLAFIW